MITVFIKTFGCSLNQSDSEVMAGLLEKAKFEITNDIEEADIILINSCTVKGPTETKFFNYLDEIKKKYPYKKVIVAGCIAQTLPDKLTGYPLIGTSQINNIAEVAEETYNENIICLIGEGNAKRLNVAKLRKNPLVEIIPICEGCLGDPCAYCKVKQARGELRSYPKEEILTHIRNALKKGAKELWLTAQDTGCYGKDIGSSLPELLSEILKIPGGYMIRLGMLNPNHVMEYLPKLIEVYKNPQMFKFLHIPVQAGNNEILKSMRRKYTVDDFKQIVKEFRKEIPGMTISTDVILGFPGETEVQFNDTILLLRTLMPDVLNISRFWPRPGTEAASMEGQVHGNETKRRSEIVTGIFNNIALMQNEKWMGWTGEVLIDEIGKENTWIGRNFAYKPVIVSSPDVKLGDTVKVKINRVTSVDLRGEIINQESLVP